MRRTASSSIASSNRFFTSGTADRIAGSVWVASSTAEKRKKQLPWQDKLIRGNGFRVKPYRGSLLFGSRDPAKVSVRCGNSPAAAGSRCGGHGQTFWNVSGRERSLPRNSGKSTPFRPGTEKRTKKNCAVLFFRASADHRLFAARIFPASGDEFFRLPVENDIAKVFQYPVLKFIEGDGGISGDEADL